MSFPRAVKTLALTTTLALALFPAAALAQQKSTIHFSAGNDNAAVDGKIKGDGYHDYLLGAKAGQKMGVSLIAKGNAYFNILPPGSNDEAIYNSSVNGNDATNIVLPANGNYTIRVYLMGNDNSAGKTVSYTVSTAVMN